MLPQHSRNLALELVRVTEAAALAAARFMGRGDSHAVDRAAVDAMRTALQSVDADGRVIIGEGEKDNAPMLYCGEMVGTGEAPKLDVAVDPIDGTRSLAAGRLNSISAIAASPRGTMLNPGRSMYMNKLAVGPKCKGLLDITHSVAENLKILADAEACDIADLTVVIMDRPRNQALVDDVRACGARIRLIQECDVAAALMTCWDHTGIDLLLGIGGSPEGILAACAVRALGGDFQGQLVTFPHEKTDWDDYELGEPLYVNDLVASEHVLFAATGVTDGELVKGIEYFGGGAISESIVIRGLTGTVRRIQTTHKLSKLEQLLEANQAMREESSACA
ncbi:class II fructose-bisphosphatase [Candidatus Bipolaricaulota bacterium]|nr:class II fructose-bisphosphatase [Candidatus Bipolaricaulota bacterium]